MDHTHFLTLHLEPPLLKFLEITPGIQQNLTTGYKISQDHWQSMLTMPAYTDKPETIHAHYASLYRQARDNPCSLCQLIQTSQRQSMLTMLINDSFSKSGGVTLPTRTYFCIGKSLLLLPICHQPSFHHTLSHILRTQWKLFNASGSWYKFEHCIVDALQFNYK